MYTTVDEVFKEAMPKRFNAAEAANDKAVFQFTVSGAQWTVAVENGALRVAPGSHDSPQCVLEMSAEDFLDMANGKESIQLLYMTGKLQVTGDLPYAIRLARYFPADR